MNIEEILNDFGEVVVDGINYMDRIKNNLSVITEAVESNDEPEKRQDCKYGILLR
jgi:hypothetical protein